jgi:FtsZ-binding cell division protein ZapB
MFSPVIDATNKNIKVVMEAMDRINLMQLEIENCRMKI